MVMVMGISFLQMVEMLTYALKGGGQLNKEGNASFQGIIHFNNIPTGNLAFLSDVKGRFKAEANNNGQLTLQIWQDRNNPTTFQISEIKKPGFHEPKNLLTNRFFNYKHTNINIRICSTVILL